MAGGFGFTLGLVAPSGAADVALASAFLSAAAFSVVVLFLAENDGPGFASAVGPEAAELEAGELEAGEPGEGALAPLAALLGSALSALTGVVPGPPVGGGTLGSFKAFRFATWVKSSKSRIRTKSIGARSDAKTARQRPSRPLTAVPRSEEHTSELQS